MPSREFMKFEHFPGIPSGLMPAPVSKRQRHGDEKVVRLRMLMSIPSISEAVARKLLHEFQTIPKLQKALAEPKTFPKIRLNDRACIGAARLKTLRKHLCD